MRRMVKGRHGRHHTMIWSHHSPPRGALSSKWRSEGLLAFVSAYQLLPLRLIRLALTHQHTQLGGMMIRNCEEVEEQMRHEI